MRGTAAHSPLRSNHLYTRAYPPSRSTTPPPLPNPRHRFLETDFPSAQNIVGVWLGLRGDSEPLTRSVGPIALLFVAPSSAVRGLTIR